MTEAADIARSTGGDEVPCTPAAWPEEVAALVTFPSTPEETHRQWVPARDREAYGELWWALRHPVTPFRFWVVVAALRRAGHDPRDAADIVALTGSVTLALHTFLAPQVARDILTTEPARWSREDLFRMALPSNRRR